MLFRPALAFLLSATALSACGVELWGKKTLADSYGDVVIRKTPIHTKLKDLVLLTAPTRKQLDASPSARFKAEQNSYTVEAFVIAYKEEEDLDFHVVLADPENRTITMIAELPDGTCGPAKHREFFNGLRQAFINGFGRPPKGRLHMLPEPIEVSITGVGFFDFLHNQDGVAANGLELHPVLSFLKR